MAKTTGRTEISDAAVVARTGRTWKEWFQLLDAARAESMSHREIASMVHGEFGAGDWWAQMITVAYERARGLREKHEKPNGYEISVSRVVAVPVATAFAAWTSPKQRQVWLPDENFAVRKSTLNKSIRITWTDGSSSVEAAFYDKGDSKSQVVAQHSKLASAKAAASMKQYWAAALDRLRRFLEAESPNGRPPRTQPRSAPTRRTPTSATPKSVRSRSQKKSLRRT